MRLILEGRRLLSLAPAFPVPVPPGHRRLWVLRCAVCRTDAKMWDEGHRDLVFPRVPGHELVVADDAGRRFVVWPGTSCGRCSYCRSGRENLCDDMRILGFHHDGGFAREVVVPQAGLVPVPEAVPSTAASFAEPTGCVLHAVGKLGLRAGERVVIYGGGTVGLIAALVCREHGAVPTVIEKSEEKIERVRGFLERAGVDCVKDTTDSAFDAALNACPDPIAFSLSTAKLGKGGRLCFFSGLHKNEKLETNLVNLLHYREALLHGAYGLRAADLASALACIGRNLAAFDRLVEAVIPLDRAAGVLEAVLSGAALKYVVDPGLPLGVPVAGTPAPPTEVASSLESGIPDSPKCAAGVLASRRAALDAAIGSIVPVGDSLRPSAQEKIDQKTKPLGALGTLEELAVRISLIQGRLDPCLDRKALLVFAADHGVAEEGVSAYPAEVTRQMVLNFLDGGAAINVLCRHHGIDLRVVDMGVAGDFGEHPALIREKIRKGTRNFALEPAMTTGETLRALLAGMRVFRREHALRPIDIVGLGEMGIANSTSASAIISVVTGISPAAAAGRGTGVDDQGLEHKIEVIEKVLRLHRPDPRDGFEILRTIGGYEIAGIAGAALAAGAQRTAVVLDGLISTAAGLVAALIAPQLRGYLISGHRSVEAGQRAALEFLGLRPVVDYRMRLGEGTGAAMAIDVADAACRIMREMATFDEAKIARAAVEGASKRNGAAGGIPRPREVRPVRT